MHGNRCLASAQNMSRARILMVLPSLSVGGAERVASEMLNFWAADNRDVALITLATAELDHYGLDQRVRRTSLDQMRPSTSVWNGLTSNWQRIHKLRAAVLSQAPDVVVSFIDRTNILVLSALLGTGIPVVVSERVDPRHRHIDLPRRLARRCLYPCAHAVVVQTQSIAHWATRWLPQDKVQVIHNPISAMPEPRGFENREQKAVAMGRLTRQKGLDLLLRAFAASHMAANGWSLDILGDGPERENLQNLIHCLDLNQQVQLVGVVKEPWRHLDQAQVFILPSRYEGFPNALLEAIAMGCSCIAADCQSGPAEIIEDGVNGLLVPVEDVQALTTAMDRLSTDADLRAAMADRAPQVRKRFALQPIMTQWDTLLNGACSKHRS